MKKISYFVHQCLLALGLLPVKAGCESLKDIKILNNEMIDAV